MSCRIETGPLCHETSATLAARDPLLDPPLSGEEGDCGRALFPRNPPRMPLALPPPERGEDRWGSADSRNEKPSVQGDSPQENKENGTAFRTPADADLDGGARTPLGGGAGRDGAR